MGVDTTKSRLEPAGTEWELVERSTRQVHARVSLADCRWAQWELGEALRGRENVVKTFYVRPAAARSRSSI